MRIGEPTLDQLRIFLTVEEEGSFGGAARRLGRPISAISYAVSQMEQQLAVVLFAREGSRRPVLTEDGRGLLAEARAVVDRADALLAKTRSIHAGLESAIGLVVDVMVPGAVTAQVLHDFRGVFPTVSLRLQVEGLGAVAECLHAAKSDLAIGGPVIGDDSGFERQVIGGVELIPVAAPGHPLARPGVAPGESREHLQLILTDRSERTAGREFSVFSADNWRLGDLGAKHDLLREGIGWGNMPLPMVAADLAAGALVALDLPERPQVLYPFAALWRRDYRLGPAASWLIDAFRDQLGQSLSA